MWCPVERTTGPRSVFCDMRSAMSGIGVGLERGKRVETKLSDSKQILVMTKSYVAIRY